jgi:DNA invertase Pin-like site-specific DNA recombinase
MVDIDTKKFERAHRYSYKLYVGDIPDGMMVLHRCDNPACVNPHHLELGTAKDNIQQAARRGRLNKRMAAAGELNGWSKLSDEQVKEIRLLRESGMSSDELSLTYGVTPGHINKICRGGSRVFKPGASSFRQDTRSKKIGDARRKVTPEMKAQIKSLSESGKTHQQIAEAVGLTQGHVSVVLQQINGGKKQKPRLSEDTINSILALHRQGLSTGKIGLQLGVPKPTVQSVLKRHKGAA